MMPDISMRSSMYKSHDYVDDLGKLIREQKQQQQQHLQEATQVNSSSAADLEKELNIYRSGSAPPTVEGSLSSIDGLSKKFSNSKGGFLSEEELRADPAYVNYYYSNVNLNPRLPPPLLSKEDWRFTQRLRGGGEVGGIGDRRKGNGSLFAVQPGFGGNEEENGGGGGGGEWGGDGLIGLPGLGLGRRQKSISEIIQDDMSHAAPGSRHPSRPPSRNAFEDAIESPETHYAHLHHDLYIDALGSGANKQGMPSAQNVGASTSHSYASALGASLSRSTTPDPQLMARAPSPRIPTAGVGRASSMDKRSVSSPNPLNGVSPSLNDSAELVAALSGLNLSTDGVADQENHSSSQNQHEIDDRHSLFNLQGDPSHMKQHSYLSKSESAHLLMHSASHSTKGSFPNIGKSSGVGIDMNNNSFIADGHMSALSSSNSYLKGPSTPTLHGGGGPPSHHQVMRNMNPAFSNFNLNGFSVNPSSPPMMGSPLGSGTLPPLCENAAAASAMAGNGLDSRTLVSLGLGPNIMAAAELQNISRLGNHTAGSALQVPLMDPLYLQYLRSNEYAAAQVAALNDPAMEIGNSYMDLLGLQKAYLGQLLSPQKLQYGVPYLGKSGSLNNNIYGNPAFGLGMSYPGGPLLPNSPVGSGSPVRHGDRNMRFSSGMRNLSGGVMGPWHSEAGGSLGESFASSLLDEFKSNKTKCFELSEIVGHVVVFSADQYGSRFIQQKLETATAEEKNMVFHEIIHQALTLMTDVFGNYVIQKFFEHGTASQIRELADQLTGHVLTLSLQMYGCRVIQKAIEVTELDQQTLMVKELDGHIMRCVRDQNGNHVIQKCIECVPEEAIQFIVSTFYDQVLTLSTHPYGCRVIQRVLEHCHDAKTQRIMMDEILHSVCMLSQDQYGNYVVQAFSWCKDIFDHGQSHLETQSKLQKHCHKFQSYSCLACKHVLEHGKPHERSAIIKKLTGQIVQMSQQKFASNVIEKCLSFGTPAERQAIVNEMLGSIDENEPLQVMMKDQFANYVVQKVLETCDDQQLELILNRIKVHLNALKKYTYGKHIVARVEKLVAAGERRISVMTPHPA